MVGSLPAKKIVPEQEALDLEIEKSKDAQVRCHKELMSSIKDFQEFLEEEELAAQPEPV